MVLYVRLVGMLKAEQGLCDRADACAEKSQWIAETYSYDYGMVVWHHLRAVISIRRRALNQALTEAEKGISLTEQAVLGAVKVQFIGFRAIAQALLGHSEAALLSVSEGERVLSGLGTVVPMFLTPFSLGRLLTLIQRLKEAVEDGSQSDVLQHQKTAYRTAKQAVRRSRKFAPYRTWILRLMGDYYWLVGKQRKALKWWDRSIKEGERLGARPDLSRTYFEVGKHLLEPQSKYKQLNGIDAKGYLEKAEILFKDMGLEKDLDDLDKVRSKSW